MIEIPERLKEFRFVLTNGKKAYETGWTTKTNYAYSDEIFQKHIATQQTYGMLCGYKNLLVVDFDDLKTQESVLDKYTEFRNTFQVKTAGKGLLHCYFIVDKEPKTFKALDSEKNTLFDGQGKLACVIGAGSQIGERKYEVVNDVEIKQVEYDWIAEELMSYNQGNIDENQVRVGGVYTPEQQQNRNGVLGVISIPEVLSMAGINYGKGNSACPLHDSNSKKCFKFYEKTHTWYCWHCHRSGDAIYLYSLWKKIRYGDAVRELQSLLVSGGTEHHFEASDVFLRLKQAKDFIEKQPMFYDRNLMWWLWNFKKFCYERVDETDVLNGICKQIGLDTTKSKERGEILNGLRQEGRLKIPMDAEDTWVQFQDTIFDVFKGTSMKASPEYFITNPIPHSIGESEDTPMMDKLFGEWVVMEGVQDESYVQTLYEILAYSLLQKQFLQRIFALQGVGSNGKGCYLKILRKFIGSDNVCTTSMNLLTSKQFESSALYKKKVCIMGEVDNYDMKNTNLLKQLSGEDDIRYEFKGKTPFTGTSGTTCIIATNALPVTFDKSIGFYRRWLIVDFPHIFTVGKDVFFNIPDVEYENLAKKSIRICNELVARKTFTNEGSVELRMKRYEDRSNPLMRFIEDECEEGEWHITFAEFFKLFTEYLNRHRLRIISKNRVAKALRDEQFTVKTREIMVDGRIVQTTCLWYVRHRGMVEHGSNLLDSTVTPSLYNRFEKTASLSKVEQGNQKLTEYENISEQEVVYENILEVRNMEDDILNYLGTVPKASTLEVFYALFGEDWTKDDEYAQAIEKMAKRGLIAFVGFSDIIRVERG